MPGFTLYTWGMLPFEVYPLNIHEMQHTTETDWARKEIVDAAIHHEWVGENEEEIFFRGRVFPHFFVNHSRGGGLRGGSSGLGHLDIIDNRRLGGQVHALVRGDGWHLGWFGIKKLSRGHTFLGPEGVGQQINFEAHFTRFPVPDGATYFQMFWGAQS